MNSEEIKLIEPVVELKLEFIAMVEEYHKSKDGDIPGIGGMDIENFEESVHKQLGYPKGIGLPDGWVPCNIYWPICQGRIIGTCELRHQLTEELKSYGGHIGYSVRPSQRGKGYGTGMLDLALEKVRALGIERALVTCDDDNIASARIIEKNGGKLQDKVMNEGQKVLTRRYWIDLDRSD